MSSDFSGYVMKSHLVIWKRGVSSHDALYSEFISQFPELKEGGRRAVKFEITPDKGYLYPDKSWSFVVDEDEIPDWFSGSHKLYALRAHEQWKKEVYALINLKEARNPINPLAKKHKPTKQDIEILKQWASVRDSVWDSVWDSVGDSVWDSVWAYAGSLFYIWGAEYKYQLAVDLWKRGFVPSFDGETWRLHSGKKAEIVYEIKKSDL